MALVLARTGEVRGHSSRYDAVGCRAGFPSFAKDRLELRDSATAPNNAAPDSLPDHVGIVPICESGSVASRFGSFPPQVTVAVSVRSAAI